MRAAISIDFHNTIARCDEWFELEVRALPAAFLTWLAKNGQVRPPTAESLREASIAYRLIREDVHASGLEQDAASCISTVCEQLGIAVTHRRIDQGIAELMRPTLGSTLPMPGTVELVRTLANSGYRLAVVSSAAYHPFLEWTLDQFGIAQYFERVVTSASCGYYKSSPRIYSLAAELLDVHPAEMLHIGDSLLYDVRSAARAGMETMFVNWNGESVDCDLPTYVVPNLNAAADELLRTTGQVA